MLVTVGLADPSKTENRENLRASLQKQLPAGLLVQSKLFHLRGGIDYRKLSFSHWMVMALPYRSLRSIPAEKQAAENRALIETYVRHVDFTDFNSLEPIIREIQKGNRALAVCF